MSKSIPPDSSGLSDHAQTGSNVTGSPNQTTDLRAGNTESPSSYGQILKSSSIIGGAQGINYLIGMVRTKVVAILLGPSGVGLVGLYVSATSLVGAFSGLGLASSGVREVAEAHGSGDACRVARMIQTLRRACWITGFLGWLLTVALAYPLSLWTFGTGERTLAVAVLGSTLLIASISGGQSALLQGTRRIGDLARLNVLSVIVGTVVAVGLYAWLGERGIVPVLIATAVVNLAFSWWFARQVTLEPVEMDWAETWRNSRRLLSLGLAFMGSGLFTAAVTLGVRAMIVRDLGLDANGVYQAAWALSGMFAGFILGAMGTDFYPRLTAAASDDAEMNRLINEQTEIGILLALPGLLGTLAFAPWVMQIFYSSKFVSGAELLPWFVLGVFGQVMSWPMGFALAAKGASGWYLAVECIANTLRLGLSVLLLRWLGLWGIALAMPLLYVIHTLILLWVCRRLTRFSWTSSSIKLLTLSFGVIFMGFLANKGLRGYLGLAAGSFLTAGACLISIRGLALRLGPEHRIVQMALRLPLGRLVCGLQ